MEAAKRPQPAQEEYKPFTCSGCELEVHYNYHGKRPPYNPGITFLEEGYFRRDPFSVEPRPLFLGAHCSQCGAAVCASPTCSMFYAKRFCLPCVQLHHIAFPPEVQRDIARAQAKVEEGES